MRHQVKAISKLLKKTFYYYKLVDVVLVAS